MIKALGNKLLGFRMARVEAQKKGSSSEEPFLFKSD